MLLGTGFLIGSCCLIGMAPGATWIVLTASATVIGTDIASAGTTCSAPPRGRFSSSLAPEHGLRLPGGTRAEGAQNGLNVPGTGIPRASCVPE